MGKNTRIRSQRISGLVDDFDRYVDVYDVSVPFTKSGQWENHRMTIDLRRRAGGVEQAIEDPVFVESLWNTLRAWGDRRARIEADRPTGIQCRAAEVAQ